MNITPVLSILRRPDIVAVSAIGRYGYELPNVERKTRVSQHVVYLECSLFFNVDANKNELQSGLGESYTCARPRRAGIKQNNNQVLHSTVAHGVSFPHQRRYCCGVSGHSLSLFKATGL